jgi:serine/threonine protein phosphatase PrpC
MENNFQFASAAVSDRGLSEKRPQNEDSFLELPQNGLFIVADGVGGAQAGDVASQMAVEIVGEAFANMNPNGDAEEVMKIGIEKANSAIFQMSHELPQLSTMATTIVALHLSGNIATIGHVGDSRLYRLDSSGQMYRETQDHSVVEEEVRAGRMTAAQAVTHPSRNVISRALGAEQAVAVDMKTIMFEPDTSFLLCSDGVTRHIDDYQLREILTANPAPQEICRLIKNLCYERGAEDNLTAVVIKILAQKSTVFPPSNVAARTFELDETTIATARVPAAGSADASLSPAPNQVDLTTQKLTPFPPSVQPFADSASETTNTSTDVTEKDFSALPDESSASSGKTAHYASAAQNSAPDIERIQSPATANSIFETDEKVYRVDADQSAGFLSKLLGVLALLVIGAMLGAAAYHLTRQTTPAAAPAPQITEMQTPNIPFSSFEENRRNIDRNPSQFIAANAAKPQDAADFYLLGRAYLLIGKYTEAKQSLTTAKNLLSPSDDINGKTLANEIAMSLAVINDPFALKAFEKDITDNKTSVETPASNGVAPANRR